MTQDTLTYPSTETSLIDFFIQREALLKPIKSIIGVVELRQVIPILANIKLVAHDKQLTLTATDAKIELTSQATLEKPVNKPQSITLPGRKLMDICRALPEGSTIHLFTKDNWACIQAGGTQFKLTSLPVSGFPAVKLQGEKTAFELPQTAFHRHLSRTYFAMAQQDVRYFLNGVCLEVTPNCVKLVATDGHRLALNTLKHSTGVEASAQIIIPQKAVVELLRLIAEETEEDGETLQVVMTKHHFQVKNSTLTFTATLIDAQYPPYQKVIPKDGDKTAVINCKAFKEGLSRATILTHERFRGVRLDFTPESVQILSYNSQQESSQESIPIRYQGEPLSISFNLSYLIDVLNAVDTDELKIALSTAKKSILLEEPDSNGDSLFVIMPVTL